MTSLVTGPTGPVGQYILEQLLVGDEPVRVLALPETMHRVPYRNRVEIVPGSLANATAVRRAAEDIDIVYHTAALMPPPARDPAEMRRVNCDGTRHLVDACLGKVRRLVFVSTVTVFTPHRTADTWPVTEAAARAAHGNQQLQDFGQSMIDAEDVLMDARARHGLEFCILRPTVICGRNARFAEMIVTSLLRQPAQAEPMNRMWGTMQWVHGSDVAAAALVAAARPAAANEVFIVAGDQSITSYDILAELWSIINPTERVNPYRAMADANSAGMRKFDYSKIRNALGFEPKVTIRQCLEEILGRIEFYSSTGLERSSNPHWSPGAPRASAPASGAWRRS